MNSPEHRSFLALLCLSASILILSCAGQAKAQTAPKAQDDSLTVCGLTLHGAVDIAIARIGHEAELSAADGPDRFSF